MNLQQRTKKLNSWLLVILALLSVSSASLVAALPMRVSAAENNDNLTVDQQHARTLLYALERCVNDHLKSVMVSATDVNAVDVFNNQSSDGVSIGYEIDTDNGARQCNNLNYAKALGFIDMSADDIRGMYACDNGNCALRDGSRDSVLNKMRQRMRDKAHPNSPPVYGPNERARRMAVTLARCIEPLGDGLHPERGEVVTIDGARFQHRDGMSTGTKVSFGMDADPVGGDEGDRDGKFECQTLVRIARNENILDKLPEGVTLATLFSNPNAISGGGGDSDGGDATEPEPSCESEGGNMSWIICAALGWADDVVKVLDRTLTRLLLVPNAFLRDEGLERAWSRLRNLAYIILIPIVLVMVIGTALGFDFVSAYTVKRAMPRLLIAAVFIALSFDITKFLVQLTNVVGVGIYGLITSAFTSDPITLESIFAPAPGQGAVGMGLMLALGVGALAVGSIGIILSYMLVTLVGLAIGFFLLSLRQVMIVALMILAPVAILAWIFPGNDKLWKLWWNTFSKLLMLFPLVMILIAAGRSFAFTIAEIRADDEWPLMISTLMKLVAYVGPFFFIPALFKFAGGAFATIAGITNDKSRGIFDRNKKYRQREMAQNWERRGARRVLQARSNIAGRLNASASQDNRTGLGRLARRGAAKMVGGYNVEAAMSEKRAQVGKELNDQIATGDDSQIRGLTATGAYDMGFDRARAAGLARVSENGMRQYKSLGGKWVNEADVVAAKGRWGGDTFAQQAALSYEMRKAQTEDEVSGIRTGFAQQAQAWRMTEAEASSAWIGAAFENQNKHLEFKYTDWQTGQLNGEGLAKEVYESRGSYNMAQMNASTIEALELAYDDADYTQRTNRVAVRWNEDRTAVLEDRAARAEEIAAAPETIRRVQGAVETFMTRYGGGGVETIDEESGEVRVREPATDPTATARGAAGEVYRTATPGAGHTAEAVRRLAVKTGNYTALDESTNETSADRGHGRYRGPRHG